MKAISIRQPWAWLIVNGYKDIENRTWNTKYRGPVLIHASQGLTHREYEEACALVVDRLIQVDIPDFEQLERGGIVGVATVTGCVCGSSSPWFFGPKGFTLTDARPLPFIPLKGKLSFFETGVEPPSGDRA